MSKGWVKRASHLIAEIRQILWLWAKLIGRVKRKEDSPSGLWRTLGKRVGCKPSGVRIPHPPQNEKDPVSTGSFSF